jgi:hypothetical protein
LKGAEMTKKKKKELGDEKASIEQDINEIEMQIKEPKNKLESKKGSNY